MRKYITLMIVLGIVEIALALYLTFWRHTFWDFVQAKNLNGFILYLGIFTVVALVICVVSAVSGYAQTLAAIKWREKLNAKALPKWEMEIENVAQRIQADCSDYPWLVLNVGFGLIKAVVYLIVFAVALILEFSAIYLVYVSIYAAIATIVAAKVAAPLIGLNYKSQQVEATYRRELTPINFSNCIEVMLGIARKTKHLQYFQTLYGQVGVIIPLIIIAPAYFMGSITFGGLMQANSIMGTIVDNMSFGVNSFGSINNLLSCRKRLTELGVL